MSLEMKIRARVGRLQLDVELSSEGGPLVLVGPNGAGKTSLLAAVLGALPVEHGFVRAGDAVLLDTRAGLEVPLEERRIGYVPQGYALFPHLDVRENIAFGLPRGLGAARRKRKEELVDELLRQLGLEDKRHEHPGRLSGGERQRVALARALARTPRALLLDEPLAALDATARRQIREFLGRTLDSLGIPTLLVTHDAADARTLGRHIAVLEGGRVTQRGSWEELAQSPATSFVSELVTPT